jgi:hypothetical protein
MMACPVFDKNGKISNLYSLNIQPVYSVAEDFSGRIWLGLVSGKIQRLSNEVSGQFDFEKIPAKLS